MRRPDVLALLGCLLVTLVACGEKEGTPVEEVLPASGRQYDGAELTWALGSEIHFGDRTLTVPGDEWIYEMQRTSYGFFLRVGEHVDSGPIEARTVYFDGETLTDVPGDPYFVRVSEDGRYAAWVEHDDRTRVVAVDLETGEEVLSYDDLEEVTLDPDNEDPDPPATDVLGFRDGHLYWDDEAETIYRAPTGTWKVEETSDAEGPGGYWVSPSQGWRVEGGLDSPDGSHMLEQAQVVGDPNVVVDAAGSRVEIALPTGSGRMLGWVGEDALAMLAVEEYPTGSGTIVRCDLATGACEPEERVPAAEDVVVDAWPLY